MTYTLNPLNITNLMTPEEAIIEAHKHIASPLLIMSLVFFSLVSLIIGTILFDTEKGKMKFVMSWLIFVVLSLVLVVFMINAPLEMNKLASFFTGFFK